MSTSNLQHTPLHAAHLKAGAKMVDFGGWDMPISYGSQIEEHNVVRQKAGMFDVSHMLNVDLIGADAYALLRILVANDVAKIAGSPGKALYTCMLNPQGGVIDDLIIYFYDETHWRIVVNAGCAEKDLAWIRECIQEHGFKLEVNPRRDLGMLAIQGPQARALVWQVRPQWQAAAELKPFNALRFGNDVMVARTGYTGEDGVEVVLPASQIEALWDDLLAAGVQPCGLGARDTLRLEAGMNLYGNDMDQTIQPAQAGLIWTVSLKDESRQFIGRDAIENNPRQNSFLGLKLNERGVIRAHMKVRVAEGEGEVTSGTMSPTLGFSIAFARLPVGTQPGTAAEVEIRGKWVSATVCKLPFVRLGKALVS